MDSKWEAIMVDLAFFFFFNLEDIALKQFWGEF